MGKNLLDVPQDSYLDLLNDEKDLSVYQGIKRY
jgi:hypothetical protein